MGCSTSKLDSLPAVALCRDRCSFVHEALEQSYCFADAHVAYSMSLRGVGVNLSRLFDDGSDAKVDRSPSSAGSGSHIEFDSESEDGDSDSDLKNRRSVVTSPERFNYSVYDGGNWQQKEEEAAVPPPPPPSSSSAWDFLNFFEPFEKYEVPTCIVETIKRENSSSEIKKPNDDESKTANPNSKVESDVEKKKKEKKNKDTTEEESKSSQSCVSEVMRKVQVQFEKASDSGLEVSQMFDGCRYRYNRKHPVSQVSSKMLYGAAPGNANVGDFGRGMGDGVEMAVNSMNLTATLKKLCMWEKKLYDEVKAEEKLRLLYAKKCRQIRLLDEKGGEMLKIDSIRTAIRTISTQIKIAFQVIDRMSIAINQLRDEELWPQINELVHRLLEMWKVMVECHKNQSQTILEAKKLDAITSDAKLDSSHIEIAIQLKFELQNWILNFSDWVDSQKGCIKALNAWLVRCLPTEPEETPDGIAPFSPGRAGAPPVFVIIYQWSQAMDRLSETEVTEAIHRFFTSINQLLEKHNAELQQMVSLNKDMDRKVKILEKEEQKIQKAIHARKSPPPLAMETSSSLHSGLKQIFAAYERYADHFKQVYNDLHLRIEEEKFTQTNPANP